MQLPVICSNNANMLINISLLDAKVCDCAPADPGSFAVPDEIEGVSFLTEGETLIWTSLASSSGSATSYEVYRELENGGPAGSSPGGSCASPPPTGTVFVDSEVPPIGTAWRYLVRGRNACGAGTWGSASNGTPRPVGNCP